MDRIVWYDGTGFVLLSKKKTKKQMKNLGEILGLAIGGFGSISTITAFTNFRWWELLFILFWVLVWAIIGGIIGIFIQESVVKLYEKWNGKKMHSKPPL